MVCVVVSLIVLAFMDESHCHLGEGSDSLLLHLINVLFCFLLMIFKCKRWCISLGVIDFCNFLFMRYSDYLWCGRNLQQICNPPTFNCKIEP